MGEAAASSQGVRDHKLSAPCLPGGPGVGSVMASAGQNGGILADQGCQSRPGVAFP